MSTIYLGSYLSYLSPVVTYSLFSFLLVLVHWASPSRERRSKRRTLGIQVKMVGIPTLKLNRWNWKIYHTRISEVTSTLRVLEALTDLKKDNGSDYWLGQDMRARVLIHPILLPWLLDSILQLNTVHEMFVYLEHKFHNANLIKRVTKKKVETCANNKVSNGQSGSANSCAAETYQTVKWASILSPRKSWKSTYGQRWTGDKQWWWKHHAPSRNDASMAENVYWHLVQVWRGWTFGVQL